jgi:hypothetical protein
VEDLNGKAGQKENILGTDTLGRDVLSRLIYGARVSMVVGLVPTSIIVIVGTIVGMIAGYTGGKVDNLLMRVTDVVYAFPDLLFFIIVMVSLRDTFLGELLNGALLLFAALAIVSWVGVARLIRGQVLSLKEKEFVEAARCIGAKDLHIMFKHILPNSLGPLIVSIAFHPWRSSQRRSLGIWVWGCDLPRIRTIFSSPVGDRYCWMVRARSTPSLICFWHPRSVWRLWCLPSPSLAMVCATPSIPACVARSNPQSCLLDLIRYDRIQVNPGSCFILGRSIMAHSLHHFDRSHCHIDDTSSLCVAGD